MSQFSENSFVQECLRESAQCIGCGTCLTSCPVYAQEAREELTARGRNRHILALLEGYGDAAEVVGKCLLCGRCTMVCPRGIRNDLIVAGLRGLMVQRDGLPFAKSVAFRRLLSDRKLMGRALRFAAAAQRLMPSEDGVGIGNLCDPPRPTVRHLPLFFSALGRGRRLPAVASDFLSERLPEENPASGVTGKKLRVAYFAGCATEFVLPRTGEAVVRVLTEAGMDVVFPHAQGCCGLASHANGDVETAAAMARHNLDVLEHTNADLIVTSCATCGTALRDIWPRLALTDDERRRFVTLAGKTHDVSELILSAATPGVFSCYSNLPRGATITWHEPCHLGRHQHVSREPLTILRRTFGSAFHELREAGCCGFGGSFNLYHYGMSQKIGLHKADNIREAGADYVVTSCPGCLIQIMDLMAQHGIPGRVIHLAEAISFRA